MQWLIAHAWDGITTEVGAMFMNVLAGTEILWLHNLQDGAIVFGQSLIDLGIIHHVNDKAGFEVGCLPRASHGAVMTRADRIPPCCTAFEVKMAPTTTKR